MTELLALTIKPVRYARKVTDGGGLYLLITPSDHRYWRYQYRFEGKQKTLALGVYPDVSLQMARGDIGLRGDYWQTASILRH